MQTLLIFGCWLPAVLVPALVPYRVLEPFRPMFVWLSAFPLALTLLLVVFAAPLAAALSYAIALIPVVILLLSLVLLVLGIRLARESARRDSPTRGLVFATVVAALPLVVMVLLVGYSALEN